MKQLDEEHHPLASACSSLALVHSRMHFQISSGDPPNRSTDRAIAAIAALPGAGEADGAFGW